MQVVRTIFTAREKRTLMRRSPSLRDGMAFETHNILATIYMMYKRARELNSYIYI